MPSNDFTTLKIVTMSSDLTVKGISDWVEHRTVDTDPAFQRRERWGIDRQSALIESFLLGLPVPPVYLKKEPEGPYTVIDGKQRITTIHSFMNGEFELTNLELATELNGVNFNALPDRYKRALVVEPAVRVVIVIEESEKDDDRKQVSYEVFRRLNTGGIALEAQEIRNAVYHGRLNDLIGELAQDEFMAKQLKTRSTDKGYEKMKDHEYVLRFFTLLEYGEKTFTDQRAMMDRFMQENDNISDHKLQCLRENYLKMRDRVKALFAESAFRRWNADKDEWRDQQNTAVYDAQSIAVMSFTDEEFEILLSKRKDVVDAMKSLFLDGDFLKSINSATASKNSYNTRLGKTSSALKALL